ncbi:MAG: hypothetical protein IKW81_07295 [Pseudobutyrivibrio sp.]|nr:hypothetical protein [Pseudobutyrivibrio sp.]
MRLYDADADYMDLIEKANQGDVDAMVKCVNYFASMPNMDNPLLIELRSKYIEELANQGNAIGLIRKADFLLEESICEESVEAALSLYALAAVKGEPYGLERIADMFYEGRGVELDVGLAKHLFWSAIFLCDHNNKSKCPSAMTYYRTACIQEETADTEEAMHDVIMLYKLAVLVAGMDAPVDEYAIKAQEALVRLGKAEL